MSIKCFILLLFSLPLAAASFDFPIEAESALLINADSWTILYQKEPHKRLYPASITKLATALYALSTEKGKQLERWMTVEQDCIATLSEAALKKTDYAVPYRLTTGGSHIGLKKDERVQLQDLYYGLLLASGMDAANVIGQYVSGSIPKFMEAMNRYLKDLGCQHTRFYNPHGLHHPEQKTTAYDMAIVMQAALRNPLLRQIISTVTYTKPKSNKQEATTFTQGNKLICKGKKQYYRYAIGGKTGFLTVSGNTFVGAAEKEGRTLIIVLLKYAKREDLFADAIKLFEAAFNEQKVRRTFLRAGPQKFTLSLDGAAQPIKTSIQQDVVMEYYPAEAPVVKCLLCWKEVVLPIKKGQQVGELRLQTDKGELLKTVPLLALEEILPTWSYRIRHLL